MRRSEPPSTERVPARNAGHPGVGGWVVAAMALLFIIAAYQFVSDRLDPPHARLDSAQTQSPVRGD